MDIYQCSPVWNYRPKDNFPVFAIRKSMVALLMLTFFIYLGVDAYLDWKNKKKEGNFALNYQLYKWRDKIHLCFADHIIGLGFAITFSPYVFETVLTFLHMVFFICLIVGEVKEKEWRWRPYYYMRLINISLFLCGMVGIGRCGVSGDACQDYLYNP